ncbi:MAG: stage II sporulation protein M [Bacilli bacterium]|nr:stage II sporulation protein M [Bacilli bacterium]MDD4809388.1 stage II sporulation protein M [Bacilli bacterium]
MKKLWDNLKIYKKMTCFLIIITLVALIAGSLFVVILDKADQAIVSEHLEKYLTNIQINKLSNFKSFSRIFSSDLIFISLIWLLGISVIGLPIIMLLYFMNTFILGFSLGGMILNYKFKGLLFSFISFFPHQIINIGIYTILVAYAINLSLRLINSIVFKKVLDFKKIINKYFIIYLLCLIVILITSLYESLLLPNLIKSLFTIFK